MIKEDSDESSVHETPPMTFQRVQPMSEEDEQQLDFEEPGKDAIKSKIALYLLNDKDRKNEIIRKFEE